MIFWRIKFDPSEVMPSTEYGYQVMDDNLVAIGVYDDNGVKYNGGTAYHTTDSGADPHLGVTPPSWADQIGG